LSLTVKKIAFRVLPSADFTLVFGQFRKLDRLITCLRNCYCRKLFEGNYKILDNFEIVIAIWYLCTISNIFEPGFGTTGRVHGS